MKRTPDPKQVRAYRRGFKDALAKTVAFMSDAARQLPKVPVVAPSVKPSSRVRQLREALARSKEELALSQAHAKAAGDEVVRLHGYHKLSDERRLELLALAQELGCDCVPHRMLEAVKALQDAAIGETTRPARSVKVKR